MGAVTSDGSGGEEFGSCTVVSGAVRGELGRAKSRFSFCCCPICNGLVIVPGGLTFHPQTLCSIGAKFVGYGRWGVVIVAGPYGRKQLNKIVQCGDLTRGDERQWRTDGWMLEGVGQVVETGSYAIHGRVSGHFDCDGGTD